MSDAGAPHMGLDDYPEMGLTDTRERRPDLSVDESELRRRLEADELVDAEAVEIRVEDGRLILDGIAETRYAKERAGSIASEIAGDPNIVENRIHVQPKEETPGPVLTVQDPDPAREPSTQRS